MRTLPSRLRRLDDALADLPLDEPMLLTELDGFLTGVLVCPELIPPSEWLAVVWGAEESGGAPFDDPAEVQWFAAAVMARYNEVLRDLGRGKLQPIFDVDERKGDVLWELWADGFAQAMTLRPDIWSSIADPKVCNALEKLMTLIAVARNESTLDSVEINAVNEEAPALIAASVLNLHSARMQRGGEADTPVARPTKVGRNDPCVCGSGRKFKRCCG